MSEEGEEGSEVLEEEEEGEEKGSEEEEKEEEVQDNPLTKETAGQNLSLLCKTGSGLAHAYVRIDLKDKGLTDITVLSHFKHVRYVDIAGNALEDISSLANLPHLLTLNADHNRLTTAHLPEMAYLQQASFAHNHITSSEGIAHPMLDTLNLAFNRISALSQLDQAHLPCLRVLDLHSNKLEGISSLCLPTLQKLYLASNKLTQCDGLQQLHQLTTLHLRENQIASLDGFVPNQAALQYINLRGNTLQDVAEFQKLKCLPLLHGLVLADNPVSEIEDYRVEVCIALRKLERLDKDEFSEDERADAEELQQQRQQDESESEN